MNIDALILLVQDHPFSTLFVLAIAAIVFLPPKYDPAIQMKEARLLNTPLPSIRYWLMFSAMILLFLLSATEL